MTLNDFHTMIREMSSKNIVEWKFRILELYRTDPGFYTRDEVSEKTGIKKASCYKTLLCLVDDGILKKRKNSQNKPGRARVEYYYHGG